MNKPTLLICLFHDKTVLEPILVLQKSGTTVTRPCFSIVTQTVLESGITYCLLANVWEIGVTCHQFGSNCIARHDCHKQMLTLGPLSMKHVILQENLNLQCMALSIHLLTGISKETIQDIFAIERENQKFVKKVVIKEKQARKRKYYSKENSDTMSEGVVSSTSRNDNIDDFDLMDEPDIQLGVPT